ncbi:endonuclease V [Hippea maritima]|uniref:Endonuclease V n=1 Tax=Hippea maritima (strain ATCC 700847 / DSM 10411 / MH2) TaxID=760142 RepID=F2LUT5_HIPMA|nr:endonuclease V [Hippea maritima]AEA33540.1 Endonuclease V [Hippea maritima DSM 10411]
MDLSSLKDEQNRLALKLNLKDRISPNRVRFVAGIDLTYLNIWKNPTLGIAALVVWDVKEKSIVDVFYYEQEVDFPYIPTFLAYRELPLVLGVFKKCNVEVDAFMLDGMGIIHPRKLGIAAHFGVVCDVVSLGCAKSHLIGVYDEPANVPGDYKPVFVENELRGFVMRSRKNANPIFISPGNNITSHSAVETTLLCLEGYRLPQPTRLAHNYLQQYRRKLLSR